MEQPGEHLKKKHPPYEEYYSEDDQGDPNFVAPETGPIIKAVSKRFYPSPKFVQGDAVFYKEPKKMTSIFKVGTKDKKVPVFQKLYYEKLVSSGMDGDFDPWTWTNRTFKKFYREMALRYTSEDQIVDGLLEILIPGELKVKSSSKKKGFYSQEDFDKVLELSMQEGVKSQEIAELSGTSEYFVDKVLDESSEGVFTYRDRGREQKFNQEHRDFIIAKAKELEGDFDLGDLKYEFDTHYLKDGLTISIATIHGILKKANILLKELTAPKGFKVSSELQKRYFEIRKKAALTVAQILGDDGILGVFYDEITFVNFQGKSKVYTFAERDIESRFQKKERQVVVAIVAMTETGDIYYALHEHSTDAQVVTAFVTQLLEELALHERKTIVFFGDNASWHSDHKIEPHLPHGVLWFKNAPASPQLNPIERVFTYVKRQFRKENTRLRYLDLTKAVMVGLESVTRQQAMAAMRITLRYLLRAYCEKTIFLDHKQVVEEEAELLINLK